MAKRIACWVGLIGCWGLACGNGNSHAADAITCGSVSPCGGDVVGTWDIDSICVSQDAAEQALLPLPAECIDSFVSAEATPQGVVQEFTADGRLMISGTAALQNEYHFSQACLMTLSPSASNLTEACQQVAAGTFPGIQFQNPSQWASSCDASSGVCECDASGQVNLTSSGNYTATNGALSVGTAALPYCVSGNQLQLENPLVNGNTVGHRQ